MSSQYSLDDVTADREFLSMGGRSFDALERFFNACDPKPGRIRILQECEYIGGGYQTPEPVRYDGAVVAEDITTMLAALSGADPAMQIGGSDVRLLIESLEELRDWVSAHPNHQYRPVYYE